MADDEALAEEVDTVGALVGVGVVVVLLGVPMLGAVEPVGLAEVGGEVGEFLVLELVGETPAALVGTASPKAAVAAMNAASRRARVLTRFGRVVNPIP